jgi:8-hydroxy-5-deazaflavin:NADPH oxidoreductase
MQLAVIGSGFIGGILGRALAGAGHDVTFGSRHRKDADVAGGTSATVVSVGDALAHAEVVILALLGSAVAEFAAQHGDALEGRLVIDATNQVGQPVANSRADLPPGVRYARLQHSRG